jgi:hemoglobin/transferrin/lactoferrin receptor protein
MIILEARRTFLIFVLFWTFGRSLFGQQVFVFDAESGVPVSFVLISGRDGMAFCETNAEGVALADVITDSIFRFSHVSYRQVELTRNQLKGTGYRVFMDPVSFNLDQVVLSASKWSQSGRDVPYKVSVLGKRDIAFTQPQTAADLLGASGKVFIQKSQQGGGSPMIRGFASNRLLYSIDGVRMNTAIFRSGNLHNVISLDAFATERAEILFGPGAVLYGSDAIGGVMVFTTLKPEYTETSKGFLMKGNANLRYATASKEQTGHLDMHFSGKKWAFVSSVTHSDFQNLRMGSSGPESYLKKWVVNTAMGIDSIVMNPNPKIQNPSGYAQLNMMQKIKYKLHKKWDAEYAFHYSTTSSFARYDRHIRYVNGLPRYGEWNYGPQKWQMHVVSISGQQKNRFFDAAVVRFSWQKFVESRIERNIYSIVRRIREEQVDAPGITADFRKILSEKTEVNYGAEAVINDVFSIGNDEHILTGARMPAPARYPKALWSSYGLFAVLQHKISEKYTMHAGLRYTFTSLFARYDTIFYKFPFTTSQNTDGAFSGHAGLVYRPWKTTVISANASTGFRSPNVDDSGKVFDAAPGFVSVPNPDLGAEYAYHAEMGIVQLLGEEIRLDASVYFTTLDKALVRRPFRFNGRDSILYDGQLSRVEAIQNAAIASARGIQMSIEVRPASGWVFHTSYNIQRGVEELDNGVISPSRHAAPDFGNTWVSWQHKQIKLFMQCQYSTGKKYEQLAEEERNKPELYATDDLGRPWSPGWTIFNIRMIWNATSNIALNVGLENISDVRYRTYSSGIAAPGRNLSVSVTGRF